jgi:hypothetical protein
MSDEDKIVPFGKHKGEPVEHVLQTDRQYIDWLLTQSWVCDCFPALHQIVINYGAEPTETPEHNRLQARLLADDFCFRVLELIQPADVEKFHAALRWRYTERKQDREAELRLALQYPGGGYHQQRAKELRSMISALDSLLAQLDQAPPPLVHSLCGREFAVRGWGVCLQITRSVTGPDETTEWARHVVAIEAKPALGDEYPAVLRQIKSHGAIPDRHGWSTHHRVLLAERITATGATEDQIRAIFKASNITLVLFDEIEGGGVGG